MGYIDLDKMTLAFRKRVIDPDGKKILISRIADSEQATDAAKINCNGFGRIRTLAIRPNEGWGKSCIRHRAAYHNLKVPPSQAETCQIFQIAACNFRCWYCYVDYNLLKGNQHRSRWFTARELTDLFLNLEHRPNILVLSGGEPDLAPEWAPWIIRELEDRSLSDSVFVWMDGNLSGFLPWEVLTSEDWDKLRRPTFAKLCGLKGIDAQRFCENTSVHPRFYERQFEVLARLIKERVEIYIELVLTSVDDTDIAQSMRRFFNRLTEIHPNLPLRVNPTEIKTYTPTSNRLNPERLKALENQYKFNEAWLEELQRGYSTAELMISQPDVRLW